MSQKKKERERTKEKSTTYPFCFFPQSQHYMHHPISVFGFESQILSPSPKRIGNPPKILLQCCYTRTRLSPRKPPPPCNTTQCSERAATVDPRKKMKKKKHDVVNLLPGGGIGGSRERKKKSYIASWEFYDAESRTTSPCCRAAVAGRGRRRNKNRYDFVS